jgi:hypothetical protein
MATVREMIGQAQRRWDRSPEYAGGELYFKITVV